MSDGEIRNLAWENGIIGKLENHWKRFPIRSLFCRGLATSFMSLETSKLKIRNELGEVSGNFFVLAIDDVGTYKSPPLYALRRLVLKYNKDLLSPAKFTVPGMVEHICGQKQQKEKEEIKQHLVGLIIRDEISKINAECTMNGYGQLLEFLCELYDGYIEGGKTRTYGYEGGMFAYYSMVGTSNFYFLRTLSRDFWTIGLGARDLIVNDLERRIGKWTEDFFFPTWNEEEDKVFGEVIDLMKKYRDEYIKRTIIMHDANKRWCDYEYQCLEEKKKEKDDIVKTLITKKAQNVLRLTINYAASIFSIEGRDLVITLDIMNRAIADVEEYFECAKQTLIEWYKQHDQRKEERVHSSKYDLDEFLRWMVIYGKDYGSPTEICANLNLSNSSYVKNALLNGANKNPPLLEVAVPELQLKKMYDANLISKELFERFKPKSGSYPIVFKITETGKKTVGTQKNENT